MYLNIATLEKVCLVPPKSISHVLSVLLFNNSPVGHRLVHMANTCINLPFEMPFHHVTYAHTGFEIATAEGLWGCIYKKT